MTLEEFIKIDNPELYDFKNEIATQKIRILGDNEESVALQKIIDYRQEVVIEKDPIIKILKYKNYGYMLKCYNQIYKRKVRIFDCDGSGATCLLSRNIYSELWGSIEEKYPELKLPMGSDTMNSFWTNYKFAWQMCNGNELNQKGYPDIKDIESDILSNFDKFNKNIKRNKTLYSELKKFATRTHTIGNFTLLINPNKEKYLRGFNIGRYAKTNDYWDLSLELMKKELCNNELFKSYVKAFGLYDYYVDGAYEIIPLFGRKKSPNRPEPQIEEEFCEYLENVNKKIVLRGETMIEELKAKK